MSAAEVQALVGILKAMQQPETQKQSEEQFKQAQNNPDMFYKAMMTIVGATEVDNGTREYAALLMRGTMKRRDDNDFLLLKASADVQKGLMSGVLAQWKTEQDKKTREKLGDILVVLCEDFACYKQVDNDDVLGDSEKYNYQNWPELIQEVIALATSDDADAKQTGLNVFCEVVHIYKPALLQNAGDMHKLLEGAFMHPVAECKALGVRVIASLLRTLEPKDWKPLQNCLGVIIGIVKTLGQERKEELLLEVLEDLNIAASYECVFFRPKFAELVEMMQQIASARDNLGEGVRMAALEFLTTVADIKPTMCRGKACPTFPAMALKASMDFMTELTEDPDWEEVLPDEEEDDDDEIHNAGKQAMDRLVSTLELEHCRAGPNDKPGQILFEMIGHYVRQNDWKMKHAALMAICQTVEYVDDDSDIDQLMAVCVEHINNENKRVRHRAWHALGQIANDHDDIPERWHQKLMPLFLDGLNDPVARVQQMSLCWVVSFVEKMDSADMSDYTDGMVSKLVEKLSTSTHRGVRQEVITCLAVIAGVVEKEFSKFYDLLMPMLKKFIVESTSEKELVLRGKSFECMSLLGMAVGKEKFVKDAPDTLRALVQVAQSQAAAEHETFNDYIKEALERIAGVLREDMGPYLNDILPLYYEKLHTKHIFETAADLGDGDLAGLTGVKTAWIEDMSKRGETLMVLIRDSGDAFLPHVEQCFNAIIPLFEQDMGNRNAMVSLHEIRANIAQCIAELITLLAKKNERAAAKQILERFCKANITLMQNEKEDAAMIGSTALGLSHVLKAVCPDSRRANSSIESLRQKEANLNPMGYLDDQTLKGLNSIALEKIKECFHRRSVDIQKLHKWTDGRDDEEDEDEGDMEEEENNPCAVNIAYFAGALMALNPQLFVSELLNDWLQVLDALDRNADVMPLKKKMTAVNFEEVCKLNQLLAVTISTEMVEYLGKDMDLAKLGNVFKHIVEGIKNKDMEVRHACGYFCVVAAPLQSLKPAVPGMAQSLKHVITTPKAYMKPGNRFRAEDLKVTMDNIVAALFKLAEFHADALGGEQVWSFVFDQLPLKYDVAEGARIHRDLLEMMKAQRQDVIGSGNAHLPKIIKIMSEVYRLEGHEEMMDDLKETLKQIPDNMINGMQQQWSQKHAKSVLKVLSEVRGA